MFTLSCIIKREERNQKRLHILHSVGIGMEFVFRDSYGDVVQVGRGLSQSPCSDDKASSHLSDVFDLSVAGSLVQ
jgi:hypothetical protein